MLFRRTLHRGLVPANRYTAVIAARLPALESLTVIRFPLRSRGAPMLPRFFAGYESYPINPVKAINSVRSLPDRLDRGIDADYPKKQEAG